MKNNIVLKVVVGVILMMQVHPNFALDPHKTLTQYIHDVWQKGDGLPQLTINAIAQTRDGYIWVATQEGLARFDGVTFTVFDRKKIKEIKHNNIFALYEDKNGIIWIGTAGGLNRLEEKKFTVYTTIDGLSNDFVRSIHEDRQGNLWIGTDNGLSLFKNNKFTNYTTKNGLSSNSVISILEDRRGNLWIGTNKGLNRFQDGKFTRFTTNNGLSDDNVRSIYEDSEENLWIGTFGGGINRFKDGEFTVYNTNAGLSNDFVLVVYGDKMGNLWIGTNEGLNRFKDGKFTALTAKEGLSDNVVQSICEDREGNLWIGTYSGGLNRLKDGKFITYTTAEGLSADLAFPVYQDRQGSIWIGTYGGGLNRLHEGKFTSYTKKDGLANNNIRSICEDREGSLWISTYGSGIARFKDGKFTCFTTSEGLSENNVRVIYEDSRGRIWIGTYGGGLNRFANGKFIVYNTRNGLSDDFVMIIFEDKKKNLWIGTRAGLNRFNDGKFTTYTIKDGLSNNSVFALYEDREGCLWIGTYGGGLNRLKDRKFTSYTTNEGLFDDVVFRILEDGKGNLWMNCNKGIFSVNKKELNDFADGKINSITCISYNEDDGMKSSECSGGSYPAGWKTRDGKLWFPTVKGVTVIDPGNIKINMRPPPVIIEQVIVDGEPMEPGAGIKFPPGKKNFEFHYTGLSFIAPKKVKFKYKLTGYNQKWIDAETRRIAYYTSIPPGHYHFKVIACNNDGVWNETGAVFKFDLKPYFYQTWWFYFSCGLLLVLSGIGFYRLRVKQLKNREKELESLVNQRTLQLAEANKELEKLSIVARKTENAVMITDPQGNIQWVNEGFTRMFEKTSGQLINEDEGNILNYASDPDIKAVISKCLEEKSTVTYETVNTTPSGKKTWIQTALTPILDTNGVVKNLVAIGSDITKIKEAEKNADMANQAKSQFLARMSHEIRTPMNGIIGFLDMLLETNLNTEQMDYARTISRCGESLLTILNDILDFSKIEAGELAFEPIDFDPEITVFDICELTQPRVSTKPVELLLRIGDDVPSFVKSDPVRFRQVIANLMSNAVKFTEHGEIELSLSVEKEEQTRLELLVKVRDTGIGIPREKINIIFDPFQQAQGSTARNYGGTGLGLAICKQIANLMGGDVRATSEPGQGSTFHFTCWVDKSDKKPGEKFSRPSLVGKKVLVVDDNQTNLDILSHILEYSGMQVVQISDSRDAIPGIVTHFKNKEPFDIVIMDIRMPGMTGYDLAKGVRQLEEPLSSLPLLAFSSSTLDRSGSLKASGFNGFLPKPVARDKLLKMIGRLLGEQELIENEEQKEEIVTQHTLAEETKHSIHILLVEDNLINQKLAGFMLSKAGYRLTTAANGEEAVNLYTAEPEKYHLILMDIQMPVMDGLEAAQRIRTNGFHHIPIIAMTAESMKGDMEKCLEAGMNDYIAKPIRRDLLYKMVKKWCLSDEETH
jgi:PAS domain S-box-containing protein